MMRLMMGLSRHRAAGARREQAAERENRENEAEPVRHPENVLGSGRIYHCPTGFNKPSQSMAACRGPTDERSEPCSRCGATKSAPAPRFAPKPGTVSPFWKDGL